MAACVRPDEIRVVPFWLKVKVVLGGDVQAVLFTLVLCLVASLVFHQPREAARFFAMRGPTALTAGSVTSVDRGDRRHHSNVYFRYSVNGCEYNSDYPTMNPLCLGEVQVEYAIAHPSCSRIAGVEGPSTVLYANPWVLGFLITMAYLSTMLPKRRRMIRLLTSGTLAHAHMEQREESLVDRKPVYDYKFEFRAEDGLRYPVRVRMAGKSHLVLEDEPREPVVYDPANPRNAFMLDSIPGRPRVDDLGAVKDSQPWSAPLVLLLPLAVAYGVVLCARQVIDILAG